MRLSIPEFYRIAGQLEVPVNNCAIMRTSDLGGLYFVDSIQISNQTGLGLFIQQYEESLRAVIGEFSTRQGVSRVEPVIGQNVEEIREVFIKALTGLSHNGYVRPEVRSGVVAYMPCYEYVSALSRSVVDIRNTPGCGNLLAAPIDHNPDIAGLVFTMVESIPQYAIAEVTPLLRDGHETLSNQA